MIERFENCELMPEKEWASYITELETKTKPSTKEEVTLAIIDAVKKRIPSKKFGVFFSGGVDSTLLAFLCKQNKADFVCYSVGLKNSPDIVIGKEVAKILGFKLVQKTFTLEELHELFKKTVKILKNPDILSVGVGSVIIAAAELGKKDGIDTFFGGLGSEEIFAGYERHSKANDVHAECWRGLKSMWQRDFPRDFDVATAMKIKVLIPFLDEEVIIKAMGISAEKKINEEQRKVILREIAEELGIPKQFAWRDKKAAQYGSRFDKSMETLARQHGFSTKMKYLGSLN
jgi:asparagine synthetase B (glutamine-hydrolysing)